MTVIFDNGIAPARRPPAALRDVRRWPTDVRTRVSSKGQIVLPAELRERDGIESGQEFDVERVDLIAATALVHGLTVATRNRSSIHSTLPTKPYRGADTRTLVRYFSLIARPTARRLGRRISSYSRETTMPSAPASNALRTAR